MSYSSILRAQKYNTYLEGVFSNELTEDSRQETQPTHVKTPLYIHQKTLLAAALDLEAKKFDGIQCGENAKLYTNYGVLADRVGSGKSLVALSLVKHAAPDEREIQTTHRGKDISLIRYVTPNKKNRRLKTALFIVPHSLMGQWEDYVTVHTSLNAIFCKRKKEVCDPTLVNFIDSVDAVFVSSTMYKFFDENLKPSQYHWSRIFVDEADSIQAQIPSDLCANFFWFITASFLNMSFPTGIFTRLNTHQAYFNSTLLKPEILEKIRLISGDEFRVEGMYTNAPLIKTIIGTTDILKNADLNSWLTIIRNSDAYIDQSFIMPAITKQNIICKANSNVTILESLVSTDVMEMLHAGDVKGALQALGVKDETPTSVIESLTHTLRRELEQNQKRLEFNKTQVDYSSEIAKQKSLETLEQRISSLQNRIETIEKRIENINTTNCPVCYSDVITPTFTPCCKNLFCFECICESLKTMPTCPLCRADITSVADLQVVSSESINTIDEANKPKTKIEEFINFIEKNPKSKILLFSGYDATFTQIINELSRRSISYAAINGSTARVSKILGEFAQGNYRVLLLNSKHVGSGLNIVSATDVFLFHKMGSEMEKQIIGRAYRMGRTEPLFVHYLLHKSEV